MTSTILPHIKVLDLSRVLAGPWCTQALADMGAEVFKIERQGVGDEMRHSPPFLRGADGQPTKDSTSYVCVNRGKRSLTIDFTQPAGQALLHELVRQCDVVVENFKAGDLQRYRLDYESLRAIKPSLVYCSITGYGQDGPMAALPGYDPVFQAISGLMSTCGLPEGEPGAGPMRSMLPLVDVMTGMVATSTVLAALLHRERTGEGQHLDICLLDTQVAMMANMATNYLATGKPPARWGNAHPNIVPYQVFPTADGHMVLAIGNDGQFARFCIAAGHADKSVEPLFATNPARVANRATLVPLLTSWTLTRTTAEWVDLLEHAAVPCSPILDVGQVLAHPHVAARGMCVPGNGADAPPTVANPMLFDGQRPVADVPPPTLDNNRGQPAWRAPTR